MRIQSINIQDSSFYFLGFLRWGERIPRHVEDTSEQQSTSEHKCCAHPVVQSEGILEVQDGEDETKELPKSDNERDDKRWALCSQDEDTTNAHICKRWSQGT